MTGGCQAGCIQERRCIKREMSQWMRKIPVLVGLEQILVQTVGESTSQFLLQDTCNGTTSDEGKDWDPEACCNLCGSNDKTNSSEVVAAQPDVVRPAIEPEKNGLILPEKVAVKTCNFETLFDTFGISERESFMERAMMEFDQNEPLDLTMKTLKRLKDVRGKPNKNDGNGTLLTLKTDQSLPQSNKSVNCSAVSSTNTAVTSSGTTGQSRRLYTEEDLSTAVRAICCGKLGTRRAAAVYGIPRSTLRNKVCKLNEMKRRKEEKTGSVIGMPDFLENLGDTAVFQVNCRRDPHQSGASTTRSRGGASSIPTTDASINSSTKDKPPPLVKSFNPGENSGVWRKPQSKRESDTKKRPSSTCNPLIVDIEPSSMDEASSNLNKNSGSSELPDSAAKRRRLDPHAMGKPSIADFSSAGSRFAPPSMTSADITLLMEALCGVGATRGTGTGVSGLSDQMDRYRRYLAETQHLLLPFLPHFMYSFLQPQMNQSFMASYTQPEPQLNGGNHSTRNTNSTTSPGSYRGVDGLSSFNNDDNPTSISAEKSVKTSSKPPLPAPVPSIYSPHLQQLLTNTNCSSSGSSLSPPVFPSMTPNSSNPSRNSISMTPSFPTECPAGSTLKGLDSLLNGHSINGGVTNGSSRTNTPKRSISPISGIKEEVSLPTAESSPLQEDLYKSAFKKSCSSSCGSAGSDSGVGGGGGGGAGDGDGDGDGGEGNCSSGNNGDGIDGSCCGNEESNSGETEEQWSSGSKRTRAKRGQYRRYNNSALMEAVRAVQSGKMSVHRAGSCYGVPHSTLEYKVKERHLLRQKKFMSTSANSTESSKGNSELPPQESTTTEEPPIDVDPATLPPPLIPSVQYSDFKIASPRKDPLAVLAETISSYEEVANNNRELSALLDIPETTET